MAYLQHFQILHCPDIGRDFPRNATAPQYPSINNRYSSDHIINDKNTFNTLIHSTDDQFNLQSYYARYIA